jgi:DNA-binding MarR family transcriptional regulator
MTEPMETEALGAVRRIEEEMGTLTRSINGLHRHPEGYQPMSRASYLLARTIDRLGPVNINNLALAMRIDATTVSRQVPPMESAGFVERIPDPQNRRVRLITLTPYGREQMDAVHHYRVRTLAGALVDWDEEEKAAFADHLARFNAALNPSFDAPRWDD